VLGPWILVLGGPSNGTKKHDADRPKTNHALTFKWTTRWAHSIVVHDRRQPWRRLRKIGRDDISEEEALAALQRFPQLLEQLFTAEQARIIQLLVLRVTVRADGLVIDLRTDGFAGVMRDLLTPRQLEAAE
jgi:hypothetical protein